MKDRSKKKKEQNDKSFDNLLKQIHELDYDALLTLNHRIVERLKKLQNLRASSALMKFNLMDKVYFMHHGEKIVGIITKINKKTVRVTSEKNRDNYWLVSPGLLTKIQDGENFLKDLVNLADKG